MAGNEGDGERRLSLRKSRRSRAKACRDGDCVPDMEALEDFLMPVSSLDHVNIRTSNLRDMVSFYSKVLGLKKGKRPAFKFGGAWLYAGNRAAVHLVEVQKQPKLKDPQLEHFAFKANDINDTLKKLQKSGAQYETRIVPGGKIRQVHAYDPDGNHVEIAFSTREEANPKLLRGK